MKTQTRLAGDIVKIPLGEGIHSYGRVLEEAVFAFYEGRYAEDLALGQIVVLPILFQVPVMDHAIKRSRWIIVGHMPLEDSLLNSEPRFMQDALQKHKFRIYHKGQVRAATLDECVGLEREAVWEPSHVEDRLRDHYAGRKNKWVESMKIRL